MLAYDLSKSSYYVGPLTINYSIHSLQNSFLAQIAKNILLGEVSTYSSS